MLPVCGKIFERTIHNDIYNYLIDNNLISKNWSGFKRGDSCINQLIYITLNILNSLDEGLEVRGTLLDISKVSDKVWHERLIWKLQWNSILDELLNILIDFLNNRKQRVILNDQGSNWAEVKAGVLRGSIMEHVLFLIHINDLSEGLNANAKIFTDDTTLFSIVWDIDPITEELNNDLINASKLTYI